MKALITMREETNQYGELIESIERSYVNFFGDLGWELIPVLSSSDSVYDFWDVDVIILTGGGTVPSQYRVSPTDEFQQKARDHREEALLEMAIQKQIPVIGICRGMQFINGYFGGKVDKLKLPHPTNVRHKVVLQGKDIIEVNSFHRDAVTAELLAPGFGILASDLTGAIVEAMYSDEFRIVAFQWHPEREKGPSACKDFSVGTIQKLVREGGG